MIYTAVSNQILYEDICQDLGNIRHVLAYFLSRRLYSFISLGYEINSTVKKRKFSTL